MTASPLRQAAKHLMAAALPRRRLLVRGPAGCTRIAITFDDGPHPQHTARLLDVLRRLGAKATFFVVGQNAERHPDLVRRIADEGHAIGNHTWSHSRPEETSAAMLSEEVRRTADLIESIIGDRPTLFRPPHGKLTLAKLLALWKLRQHIVLWNQDPRDYQDDAPASAAALSEVPLRGGDILLLHDRFGVAAKILPGAADAAERIDPTVTFDTVCPWIEPS